METFKYYLIYLGLNILNLLELRDSWGFLPCECLPPYRLQANETYNRDNRARTY